jgi:hypothetical protein
MKCYIKTVFILLFIIGCISSNGQIKKPKVDTTSIDYLDYLLKNEKSLNNTWIQKLDALQEFLFPLDSMTHLSITRKWKINDSISAIILAESTGVSYDVYLLTVKNKRVFISKVHIGNNSDSDGYPYYYTKYKFISDRKVKMFNHKMYGDDGEYDKIESIEYWYIHENGKVLKR